MNQFEYPHRRYNPLTGEWILVSPHRTKRPWLGQVEKTPPDMRPAYDPGCYLCPSNKRASGEVNAEYTDTFVFTNDFQAILPDSPEGANRDDPLMQFESVRGTCRVLCFSPRHDLSLAEMDLPGIGKVIEMWAEQITELGRKYRWVQVFENKGAVMGCSNPHPHGQVWVGDKMPNEAFKEDVHQKAYYETYGHPLLVDYASREAKEQLRVVVENEEWIVVVPYWAVWPYETLVLPREHVLRLPDLSETQRSALADVLKRLLVKYDNLFEVSFPYSMGWHGAPLIDEGDYGHWQLHAHYYPPLLRSATVKKFMVGYEMLGEPQRDITAEQAAERLRELSEMHYRLRED